MGLYTISRVTGVAAALCRSGQVVTSQSGAPVPPQGTNTLVYIGTYTGPKAKGIYFFRLQSAGSEVFQNVTLVPLGLAAETPNPSFIEIDSKRRLLFAVNEIDEFEGKPSGAVSAWRAQSAPVRRRALLEASRDLESRLRYRARVAHR